MEQKQKIAKLDPKGKYVIFVHVSRNEKHKEEVICNKVELAFKAMGVKNVKALPNSANVFEVS